MIKNSVGLSAEFKSQTVKAIGSIVIFFLVYLLLLAASIAFAGVCMYGGLMLIVSYPKFITIMVGIGLAILGFLVFAFLIKFIFKVSKKDTSNLVEIKKEEEPALFEFISKIVNEVGTQFPKKIFLSSEVNASVFYNSSFWSMFLPIRKNLVIGMGLVNTLSVEEFRSVLAHEFGHFSQKTMKVGSFVYNVNQIIYNMLFENSSYTAFISSISSVSGYFAFFVQIAVNIVRAVQSLLKWMYSFINKRYMALSREMEFHADEIAANVTGFSPLKSGLLRLNLAELSMNAALGFYEGKIHSNERSKNVFAEQSFVMSYLAAKDAFPIHNGLPQLSIYDINKFNRSRLVVENQWASHPSMEDRIARLEQTGIVKENQDGRNATVLFKTVDETQASLTNDIFNRVQYAETPSNLDFDQFQQQYIEEAANNNFNPLYNQYYDNKDVSVFSTDSIAAKEHKIEDLFSDEVVSKSYELIGLRTDKISVTQILNNEADVKTFDYDGKKYQASEAASVLEVIDKSIKATEEDLKINDENILQHFLFLEAKQASNCKLLLCYKEMFDYDSKFEEMMANYDRLVKDLYFIGASTPYDEIRSGFANAKQQEDILKTHIRSLITAQFYAKESDKDMKENFEKYLSQEWVYFGVDAYYDDRLIMLTKAINQFPYLVRRHYFSLKKELLDYQAMLVEKS